MSDVGTHKDTASGLEVGEYSMVASSVQLQHMERLGTFTGKVSVPVKTLIERLTAHGVCSQCAQAIADCLRASKRASDPGKSRYWATRALIRLNRCEAGECDTRRNRLG